MTTADEAEIAMWLGPRAAHWGARSWGAPERIQPGFSRRCWGNARRAAAADPGLGYVEGIVQRAGYEAELHGWCVDLATGGVVEVTGPLYADAESYRGVMLDPTAVEHFLDRGDRREHWGVVSMLGEVHAEPPAVLFILMDELHAGVRSSMATWAAWRQIRRPAGRDHPLTARPYDLT